MFVHELRMALGQPDHIGEAAELVQPKRQPLTFVDIMLIAEKFPRIHAWIPADELSSFVAAVEAKLKELNND